MDDWWDVDERGGFVRGQRTGTRIGIGDVAQVYIVKVDVPRRELGLAIHEIRGRSLKSKDGQPQTVRAAEKPKPSKHEKAHQKRRHGGRGHAQHQRGRSRRGRGR
jgi:hypothetical protein